VSYCRWDSGLQRSDNRVSDDAEGIYLGLLPTSLDVMQAALGSSQKGDNLSKAEGAVASASPLSPEEWAARMPAQLVSACSRQPNREDKDTWLAFLLKPKWNTAALLNGTTMTKRTDRLQIPAEYVVWLDEYLQFENIKPDKKRHKVRTCHPEL
jgi:hypothetical protein